MVVSLLLMVLSGSCIYFHSRSPQFSGAAPQAMDVEIPFSSTNTYRSTITNREACQAIFKEFHQAHSVFFVHKSAARFTFRFANGKVDTAQVTLGTLHGYSYFFLRRQFQMDTDHLYQALKEAGVDVSKICN